MDTALRSFLRNEFTWTPSTSAATQYERMPNQGPDDFPGVTRPHDPSRISDWLARVAEHRLVLKHLPPDGEVLDVGIGDGWPTLIMFDRCKSVLGIDPSPHRVEVAAANAKKRGAANCSFEVADACALPYPDASFDAVTAFSSTEQSADPPSALAEFHRVLRPGGVAIISVERHQAEMAYPDYCESLWMRWREDLAEMQYVFDKAEPVTEEHWYFTLPAPLAAALLDEMGLPRDTTETHLREANRNSLLLTFLQRHKAQVQSCEYYALQHFTEETLRASLLRAGFSAEKTLLERYFPAHRMIRPMLEDLERLGFLRKFASDFDAFCAGFAEVKPVVEAGKETSWLAVAHK